MINLGYFLFQHLVTLMISLYLLTYLGLHKISSPHPIRSHQDVHPGSTLSPMTWRPSATRGRRISSWNSCQILFRTQFAATACRTVTTSSTIPRSQVKNSGWNERFSKLFSHMHFYFMWSWRKRLFRAAFTVKDSFFWSHEIVVTYVQSTSFVSLLDPKRNPWQFKKTETQHRLLRDLHLWEWTRYKYQNFLKFEQWLWHSWQRSRFQCQRARVRIQSSATFIGQLFTVNCL